jgi:hypothetical protein
MGTPNPVLSQRRIARHARLERGLKCIILERLDERRGKQNFKPPFRLRASAVWFKVKTKIT